MTTFLVDIDQTIATGHTGTNLAESIHFYQASGLVIPAWVHCWSDLWQVPAVLRQYEALPGALAGVWQLATAGKVRYATCRSPRADFITRGWLYKQGFPSPGCVLRGQQMTEVLQLLAQDAGPLVFIDHRWQRLLEQWPAVEEQMPALACDLRQRFTLVAFGASQADIPEVPAFPVRVLSDWWAVGALLTALHQGITEGSRKSDEAGTIQPGDRGISLPVRAGARKYCWRCHVTPSWRRGMRRNVYHGREKSIRIRRR